MKLYKLADYHAALSDWVLSQRERLGSAEEPVSHDVLAARMMRETGAEISGESLRGWEAQERKRRISGDKQATLAAWCIATGQEIPEWLGPTIQRPDRAPVSPIDYIAQATPEQAGEIAEIVAAGVKWLSRHGYPERNDYPITQQALLGVIADKRSVLVAGGGMTDKRISALLKGATPTLGEAGLISRLFDPPGDADRILRLYKVKKARV
jgi:hypothetical protein